MLLLFLAAVTTAPSPWEGSLCLRTGANVHCVTTTTASVHVDPGDVPRQLVWTSKAKDTVIVDTLPANANRVMLDSESRGTLALSLRDTSAPSLATTLLAQSADRRWQLDIPAGDVRLLRKIVAPPSTYRIEVSMDHRRPVVRERTVVTSSHITNVGAIDLLPLVAISGRVTAKSDGKPIGGATIVGPNGKTLDVTDQEGLFRVEFASEPTLLSVAHADYATKVVPLRGLDRSRDLGTISLGRASLLRVSFDVNERRVSSAELFRVLDVEPTYLSVARRDVSENRVTFDDLEPGDYLLVAQGNDPLQRAVDDVTISAGENEKKVTIHPIQLEGHVYLDTKPLAAASVEITSNHWVWQSSVTTDADGAFLGESWSSGQMSATVRHDTLSEPYRARSRLTGSPAYWDIVIPDRTITGRVVDAATKEPIAGAIVIERYRARGVETPHHSTTADTDGSWRFTAAGAGDHAIHAEAHGYLPSEPKTVNVAESDRHRQLDIALVRAGEYTIHVTYDNGAPVANAWVIDTVSRGGFGISHESTTDAAGTASITLEPGSTRPIYIVPREGSFAIATLHAAGGQTFDIVVPRPASNIRVRATTETGQPMSHVGVLLRFNGDFVPPVVLEMVAGLRATSTETGSEGETVLSNLPPGSYEFWPFMTIEDAQRILTSYGATRSPIRAEIPSGDSTIVLLLAPRTGASHGS